MIRKVSKRVVRKTNVSHFEPLEDRRLLSASLSVAQSMMVFNAVKNTGNSYTETLALTDTGDAPLNLGSSGFSIVNDPTFTTQDAARFKIVNASSIPATLTPGQTFNLQLNYNANAAGINSAFLDIASNDPVNPMQQVALRGIGTVGLGGTNQPSLARILQAYEIPTLVGEGPNDNAAGTDTTYPAFPDASSQEVAMQQMVAAGPGPVTIQVLASFDAAGTKPYTLGTYVPGNPNDRSELFFTPTSEYQTTYVQPQGATSFNPGSAAFGFYFVSNIKDNGLNRIGYSEDQFNTWDTTPTSQASNPQRKFRFFPLENPDGSVVPNAYIMTSTEWQNPGGYDFTNIVAIVRNVMPAPGATAPVLGLQESNPLPGSDTIIFNRIQIPNPTLGDQVHDTSVLTINNTGASNLIISSYSLTNAWTLVSPPPFPLTVLPGTSTNLTLQFIAQSEPAHAVNQTQSPSYPNGGGLYNGTLTLNTNDPTNPTANVPLAGWWQQQSEHDNEPSLQTLVNLMAGWTTNINSTTIPDLTENANIPSTPTYYGEEVVSSYWSVADPSQQVNVVQLDSFHTEGNTAPFGWFSQGSGTIHNLWTTAADYGQTLFPAIYGTTTPASALFSPGSTAFGFKTDTESSVDSQNMGTGGGHHIRFFPVRDASGNIVPNTYIMAMDYSIATGENFDFQDNAYIVSNIRPASVAPAPTDLYATNSATVSGAVQLQWAPVSYTGLVGYNIYRSLSPSGGFQLLNSTPVNAISYLDVAAPPGETLYYKVTAVGASSATESLGMFAGVVTTGTPIVGLQSIDIGATPAGTTTTIIPGSAYNVVAGGGGISGTSDEFRYLFQTQTGNFDYEVQVQSITVAGSFSTAGIMARTTLDGASTNVYMSASPANYRFKYRTSVAASEAVTASGTVSYPNVWVRLTRVGNLFTGYTSTDGNTWTKMSSITLNLPSTVFLGLAVASNSTVTPTSTQLRNFQPTSTVPIQPVVPPTPANLVATGVQGGVSLTWTAVTDANLVGYNVYSSSSATGTFSLLTSSPITATTYLDLTAAVGATTYYQVTAVDSTTTTPSLPATASAIAQAVSTTGMQSVDINATLPGTTTVITPNTDFNVTAGGAGIGGTTDEFRYIYQSRTGNFDVAVQVESLTVAGTYSTAGIMARTSLDPASADVYMSATPVNFKFKDRTSQGATAALAQAGTTTYPNVWVRLTRVGNVFTGYYSADGVTWTKMSSVTIALPSTIDLGVAVASNAANVTTTAQLRGYGPTTVPVSTTPPTPSNFTATGVQGGVSLNWSPVSYTNLKGYNVYSSSSSTGTYTLLTPTPITGTTYLDSSAAIGSTTYYEVTAVDATTSAQSTAATANGIAQAVSTTGMQSVDINATLPGTTTVVTPGTDFNVTAGGAGIGGTTDEFRYIYQSQTGNFDVAVQVLSLTVAGTYSTAGIMARTSLDPASADVYMAATPVNFKFKDRASTGATAALAQAGTNAYPNVWVRLARVGNVFTGYYSSNGTTWTQMSSVTVALPTTIDLGLAVASNAANITTTAQLRGYGPTTTTPPPSTPPAPTGFTATGGAASIALNWAPETYANLAGYDVYRSTSSAGPYTLLTPTPITATSYADSNDPAGEILYYKVTAVDATTFNQSPVATAQAAAATPTTLTSIDIGTPGPTASTTTVVTPGSAYTVTAGGPGVGGTADNFNFNYAQQTGDFDVMVQVNSLTVAGNYATAGLMARASLDANSQMVYMSASPANYRFKDRTTTGGTANIIPTGTTTYPNVYLRLTRVGNLFTGYTSADGIHWTVMSSVTMALPSTIYLGLGVASNDTTDMTTAQLSNYGNT